MSRPTISQALVEEVEGLVGEQVLVVPRHKRIPAAGTAPRVSGGSRAGGSE